MVESSSTPPGVTAEQYRDVIGRFATGVTVITSVDGRRWYGTTASAVSSLSLEPPMLVVCMNRESTTGGAISRTGSFAVNILAEGQDDLARQFARKDADKFQGVPVTPGLYGEPLLDGALAYVECMVTEQVVGGTHTVFLGEVDRAWGRAGTPLAYFRGQYGRLHMSQEDEDPLPEEPDGSFAVVPLTIEAIEDTFRARLTLHLGAAALTVGRMDAEQLAGLRRQMEGAFPRRPGGEMMSATEWFEADRSFHECMLAAAGSETLLGGYRRLMVPGLLTVPLGPEDVLSDDIAVEHSAILEAYETGDLEAAVAALQRDHERALEFHRQRLGRAG